ncbi:MAG: TonB family protein, partial [Burkholderiales bacterium]|nr:TonB family protein [Burkholderiales bacterium]
AKSEPDTVTQAEPAEAPVAVAKAIDDSQKRQQKEQQLQQQAQELARQDMPAITQQDQLLKQFADDSRQQADDAVQRQLVAIAAQQQLEKDAQIQREQQQKQEQQEQQQRQEQAAREERLRLAQQQQADELKQQQAQAEQTARQNEQQALELARRQQEELAKQQQMAAAALQKQQEEQAAKAALQQQLAQQKADELAARQQAEALARQQAEQLAAQQKQIAQAAALAAANAQSASALKAEGSGTTNNADSRRGQDNTAQAAGNATGNRTSGAGNFVLPKSLLGSDLANRAREQAKGLDLLSGNPPRIDMSDRPRRRSFFGSVDKNIPVRMYVDSWKQKIERNGNLNYSQSSRDRARGDPVVTVVIRSDGSVEDVTINRSSGRADLDEAVRRIVRLNARYAAFPPNIAAEYDVIEIRRIWSFDDHLRILEELR